MSDKTPISNASSYEAIGEFWAKHDSTEYGDEEEVEFEIKIQDNNRYFLVDDLLFFQIRQVAEKQGVSAGNLLNTWLKEKLKQVGEKATL